MQIELLEPSEPAIGDLAELLVACVAAGASVGFLRPLAPGTAESFWRKALADPEALIVQLDGVPVSFDFGMESSAELVAQLAPRLEIAFFSGAGLDREQAVALGERAVAVGAALAVVTRGRSGSMALNSSVIEVPAQPVDVVDTLGAGDALIAAVIAARVRGQEIEQALAAGSAAAARACRHYGAWE